MADVFISYKKGEQALVKRIADALASYNITVWWDESLAGGQVFRGQIEDEISKAKAVIVIWTESSAKSDFVLDEADRAKNLGKLLPVRFSNSVKIPLGFGQLQTETLEGWLGAPHDPLFERVVDQIGRISQRRFSLIAQALGPNLRATAETSTRAASAIWESLRQAEFLGLPLSRLFGWGVVATAVMAVALALLAYREDTTLTLFARLAESAMLAAPFFLVVRALHQFVMFKKGAGSRRVFDPPFRFWLWLSALIATMHTTLNVDVADPMNIVRGVIAPFALVLGAIMLARLVLTLAGGGAAGGRAATDGV